MHRLCEHLGRLLATTVAREQRAETHERLGGRLRLPEPRVQLCALPIVGMARAGELLGDCLACLTLRPPLPLQPLAPQLILEHSVHRIMRACCLV